VIEAGPNAKDISFAGKKKKKKKKKKKNKKNK
jgi:hypothetical protein